MVISNSSPLIALSRIGSLELLNQLYGDIYIPEAVKMELERRSTKADDTPTDFKLTPWIKPLSVTDRVLVNTLELILDRGEAETIALALELKQEIVLMDERIGRSVAKKYELTIVGTLGVLLEAKQKKLIPRINPILNLLKQKAGFYLSESLILQLLKEAEE